MQIDDGMPGILRINCRVNSYSVISVIYIYIYKLKEKNYNTVLRTSDEFRHF